MKKYNYILLLFLISIYACQNDLSELPSSKGEAIMVSANVSLPATTRAAYNSETPTSDKPFDAMVWASTTTCDFPYNDNSPDNGSNGVVGYHATVNFQNGSNQLMRDGVVYPSDNRDVYFIGLYPNSGWSDNHNGNSNTSTSFTISGKEDVMYAPQVTGHKNASTDPTHPSLHFFHLLTWLRIEVYAENASVASSWGKLTDLKLTNQQRTLGIALSSTVPDTSSDDFATRLGNVATKVSFSGATDVLSFYATGTDNAFGTEYPSGYTLTTEPTEVAYVLCQPVSATEEISELPTNEYVLQLTTEHRSNVTVNVDLKTASETWFTGSTMGHQFVLKLKLCAGGYISASASVTDWVTGGYVTHDVE